MHSLSVSVPWVKLAERGNTMLDVKITTVMLSRDYDHCAKCLDAIILTLSFSELLGVAIYQVSML